MAVMGYHVFCAERHTVNDRYEKTVGEVLQIAEKVLLVTECQIEEWTFSKSVKTDRTFYNLFLTVDNLEFIENLYYIGKQIHRQAAPINEVKFAFSIDSGLDDFNNGNCNLVEMIRNDPFLRNKIYFKSPRRCRINHRSINTVSGVTSQLVNIYENNLNEFLPITLGVYAYSPKHNDNRALVAINDDAFEQLQIYYNLRAPNNTKIVTPQYDLYHTKTRHRSDSSVVIATFELSSEAIKEQVERYHSAGIDACEPIAFYVERYVRENKIFGDLVI